MKRLGLCFALLVLGILPLQAQWITGFWSAGNSRESIANIPWSNITHLTYFAAGISSSGTVVAAYTSQPELANLVAAAHANGKKILIVLSDGTGNHFEPAAGASLVSTTASNIASYVNANNFDGVDFDWELSINATDYESLVSHTRTALGTGKLIAADVVNAGSSGGPLESMTGNQYPNLDQINVMCYDMDIGTGSTWYNDPLLMAGGASGCDWRINQFTNAGVPAAKIGVGMPFYARHWTGTYLALQTGGSQAGSPNYSDLVNGGLITSTSQKWDATHESDYLSFPGTNEFYSYNGPRFIDAMVPWAKSKGYGGYMIFTLEYEYLTSQSGAARYPLSTELHNQVFGGSVLAPIISVFTASPGAISAGASSTLSWSTTGSTSLSISPGVGTVTGLTSTVVHPSVTTIYALTAANSSGAVTRSTTVNVTPVINSFTATPSTPINPGTPVTLAWTSTGGTSATLNGSPVALSGTQIVSPLTTTAYTLVVSNSTSPASQTVTVNVGALPVISSFTATPSTIALGGSSTLTLASTGGTTCSIDQGVGTVACNSSTSVSPLTSKLYTVTVHNGFGDVTAKALVGVSISALVGAAVVNGQVVIH